MFAPQRRLRIFNLLIAFVLLAFAFTPAPVLAQDLEPVDEGFRFFLPIVENNFHLNKDTPRMMAPANGAVLDTLIPTFSWSISGWPIGYETEACIAVDINPDPINCHYYLSYFINKGVIYTLFYNLDPDTTYYWRVGARASYEDDYKWSDTWKFTTGLSGGPIPAAPQLVSPVNYSTLSYLPPIIDWEPVDGALAYEIWISDPSFGGHYILTVDGTVTELEYRYYLETNQQYEWFVRARNHYAWGKASDTWTFYTPSALDSSASPAALPGYRLDADGGIKQVR